jgi:hypothetical protein
MEKAQMLEKDSMSKAGWHSYQLFSEDGRSAITWRKIGQEPPDESGGLPNGYGKATLDYRTDR